VAAQLTQPQLDQLKAYHEAIGLELAGMQILLDARGGLPGDWPPGVQSDILTAATLLVWWLAVDLACYPIGPNSVVLYGEPPPI
jgi:hypothetical protein